MGKFTINDGMSGSTNNYIPEDNGWTWVSEEIAEPIAKYNFASKGMASGFVDMSLISAGSLVYDSRNIKVTFARFKKGADGWLDDVESTIASITSIFGLDKNFAIIYPKTISTKYFNANGFNYEVTRDGIIQYLTIKFKCQPIGRTITT